MSYNLGWDWLYCLNCGKPMITRHLRYNDLCSQECVNDFDREAYDKKMKELIMEECGCEECHK